MSENEYNQAVMDRYKEDKRLEWEQLMDDDYDAAHCLQNDGGHYVEWYKNHVCENYLDYNGTKCVVCGKNFSNGEK